MENIILLIFNYLLTEILIIILFIHFYFIVEINNKYAYHFKTTT